MSDQDLMWAIGLFEGEGCIGLHRAGRTKADHVRDTRLTVISTDLDVLERFNDVVGCGKITRASNASSLGKKEQWQWRLSRQTDVRALLHRMRPFLGSRRRAAADVVLGYIDRDRTKRVVKIDLDEE